MIQAEFSRLENGLTRRTGANVRVDRRDPGNSRRIIVTLAEVDPRVSFAIEIEIGYQRIELAMVPGSFAGPLVAEMGRATEEEKMAFSSLADTVLARHGQIAFLLNGETVPANDISQWPLYWTSLALKITRAAIDIEGMPAEERLILIEEWGSLMLLMCFALATRRDDDLEPLLPEPGLPEGARTQTTVNRYERSRVNRLRCIAIHGARCKVCGLEFKELYGRDLGDGFIHVHHVVPVSRMGAGYIVDPARDLVPVCPNCHSMIHRKDPALSVDELRGRLSRPRSERHEL